MKTLRMKVMTLVVLGLGAVGCGGTEELASQEQPGATEPGRARLWEGLEFLEANGGSEERRALATDPYFHEVVAVCGTTSTGASGCENVQGWDDTANDFVGTVQVYTHTRDGNGSSFASFNNTYTNATETLSSWPGGVLLIQRRYTLSNLGSGTFYSQMQRSNNAYYSDTVYIY